MFATVTATTPTNRPLFLTDGHLAITAIFSWRLKWTEEGLCEFSPQPVGRYLFPVVGLKELVTHALVWCEAMGISRATETLMLETKSSKISISGQHPNLRPCENKGKGALKSDRPGFGSQLALWSPSTCLFWASDFSLKKYSAKQLWRSKIMSLHNACALLKYMYSSIFPSTVCSLRAGTLFCLYACKSSKVPST